MSEVKERPAARAEKAQAIRSIGVIGAGQMGSGIAHVCALSGFDIRLNDVSADRIKAGIATINGNEAATARAAADGWKFDITVIRAGGQVYRLLPAAPTAALQAV